MEAKLAGVPPPPISVAAPARPCKRALLLLVATAFALALSTTTSWWHPTTKSPPALVEKVQQCAIDNLHADLSFLDAAVPIKAEEFLERRDRLAVALAAAGVDAFVLEPGYTFQ